MTAHEIRVWLKANKILSPIYMPVRNLACRLIENRAKALLRKRFKKYGLKTVAEVDRHLNVAGVRYYLDYGGLLGWVRENRFLPWDPDLDFAVIIDGEDTIDKLRGELLKAGYPWRKEYFDEKGRRAEDMFVINGIGCDFFYQYREDGMRRVSLFSITEKGIEAEPRNVERIVYNHPKSLVRRTIGGVETWFPEDAEATLAERYGKNWRTPVPGWRPDPSPNRVALGPVGRFVKH